MSVIWTVNSQIIADVQVQAVLVHSVLGSYEISFLVSANVHPLRDAAPRWLVVHSAQVNLKGKAGQHTLPIARTNRPAVMRQNEYASRFSFELKTELQPHQLELIEIDRDGGDLDFELRMEALGGGGKQRVAGDWPEQPELKVHVAESDWVAQLNSSGALRVLLLEIPMPFSGKKSVNHAAEKHLLNAQKHFVEGNYRECVSECRQFAEELGGSRLSSALTQFEEGRTKMSKDERETAILAMLQHYAHLAVHSDSKGGTDFSRSDAKLALSLAAALAAHSAS